MQNSRVGDAPAGGVADKRLSECSDNELLEELVRRRVQPPEAFCEDCQFFTLYEGRSPVPEDYNPCAHGHALQFLVPEDRTWCDNGAFGFYRVGCDDRG